MVNIEKLILILLATLTKASEVGIAGLYVEKDILVGCSFPVGYYTSIASVQKHFKPNKCGVCLKVSFNNKSKIVRIVDSFEAGEDKVQLDKKTFDELGLKEGVSEVTYDEVVCPETKPKYKNVVGSNKHWAQFVIYDHPTEIKEVYAILSNGHHQLLERKDHNTYEYPKQDGVVISPLLLRVVDIYNNDKVDEIKSLCTKTEFGGITPFHLKDDKTEGYGYNIHVNLPSTEAKPSVEGKGDQLPTSTIDKLEDKKVQTETLESNLIESQFLEPPNEQSHEPVILKPEPKLADTQAQAELENPKPFNFQTNLIGSEEKAEPLNSTPQLPNLQSEEVNLNSNMDSTTNHYTSTQPQTLDITPEPLNLTEIMGDSGSTNSQTSETTPDTLNITEIMNEFGSTNSQTLKTTPEPFNISEYLNLTEIMADSGSTNSQTLETTPLPFNLTEMMDEFGSINSQTSDPPSPQSNLIKEVEDLEEINASTSKPSSLETYTTNQLELNSKDSQVLQFNPSNLDTEPSSSNSSNSDPNLKPNLQDAKLANGYQQDQPHIDETYNYLIPYDRSGHGEPSGKKVRKVGLKKEISNEGTSYAGKKICVPVTTF